MNGEAGFGHPHPRPTVSRVGGVLLLAGGALSLVTAALNASEFGQTDTLLVIACCFVAIVVGALGVLLPSGAPAAVLAALPVFSAVLICLPMYLVGTASDGSELLLVWSVLFAGYFLGRSVAWTNLVAVVGLYGATAVVVEGRAGLTPALCLAGTSVVALVIVSSLRERLVELLARVREEARTDGLTGLLNRRAFDELVAHEVARCARSSRSLTLLLIDLDRFKQLNDAHGHLSGDEALRRLAALLRTQMRDSDVLARFGGEEFAILLPACGADDAVRRAEHIRSLVERSTATWQCPLTVSIGVATLPDHGRTVVELLTAADTGLYAAKDGGRNSVVVPAA